VRAHTTASTCMTIHERPAAMTHGSAAFRVSISRRSWLLRAAAAEELGYFGGRPAT